MKGVILAGGTGSRLFPATRAVNKHLSAVYDKPMIYYPLTTLMLAGIQEVALVSDVKSLPLFKRLLGSGHEFGIRLSYLEQDRPGGIAHALHASEEWIGDSEICLILGDNLFYGPSLGRALSEMRRATAASILGFRTANPSEYAVIEYSESSRGEVLGIQEKPPNPASNWVVPGLYFLPVGAAGLCGELTPSHRGELEIVDLLNHYLAEQSLVVTQLPRGVTWFDVGTVRALSDASLFVRLTQERSGSLVGSPEEAAWQMGWIGESQLASLIRRCGGTEYADCLQAIREMSDQHEISALPSDLAAHLNR